MNVTLTAALSAILAVDVTASERTTTDCRYTVVANWKWF